MIRAVYPGSFDPVTNGHLDIILRAAKIFDRLSVVVMSNQIKNTLFSVDERIALLREVTRDIPNVVVTHHPGLLVHFMQSEQAQIIIKGLRAVSDFEYEFQMALMNRTLDEGVETLFMMTNNRYSYLSSSLVKEVTRLGGSVDELVHPVVAAGLRAKFSVAPPISSACTNRE